MPASSALLPDLTTLTHGLASLLQGEKLDSAGLEVLARRPARRESTFPNEIVTCRLGDGRELQLFCKYEAGQSHNAYGHRGGIPYEAAIYREVLQPSRMSTPMFLGLYATVPSGQAWLVLDYVAGSVRVKDAMAPGRPVYDPDAMRRAAQWLGHFHAEQATRLAKTPLPFVHAYDREYYVAWGRRTCRFATSLHRRFPWLSALGRSLDACVAPLLAAAPTLIHGEYYPNNILIKDGMIYPIDWESAAIAAGEVDLAALTERWPSTVVHECEAEYRRTRWPHGAPDEFQATLAAARLYLQFRWLGERPDWTIRRSSRWRFAEPRAAAERLGLL